MKNTESPLIGLIMGSQSDWDTMQHCAQMLKQLTIPFEQKVISAHRTPDAMFEYASAAEQRGLKIIIAAAGGAAHLPGMVASKTSLPVIGVPICSKYLQGMDSLLSIVQMPTGTPVATMAIGEPGAKNSAVFAAAILGLTNTTIKNVLAQYRKQKTASVLANPNPGKDG